MAKKTISPFDGKPTTTFKVDKNGQKTVTVTARALTPDRLRMVHGLSGLTFFPLLIVSWVYGYETLEKPLPDWAVVVGLALPIPIIVIVYYFWVGLLKKTTVVEFTPSQFRIKKLTGWKTYDRMIDHQFGALDHDLAEQEQLKEQEATIEAQLSKKQPEKTSRYYRESSHIVFVYMGQRVDIATVHGKKDMQKILYRLNAVDEYMNSQAQMGGKTPEGPQSQWDNSPGDID